MKNLIQIEKEKWWDTADFASDKTEDRGKVAKFA